MRGLPAEIRAAALREFSTCRDVLDLCEIDLVDRLDLFLPEVRALVQAVALHVMPRPPTALGLLHSGVKTSASASANGREFASIVPTGLSTLDAHLGGGLPRRAVTELVGPAGAGKTQLCLSVAARALIDGSSDSARVIYVDTEGSFSASRLLQLLLAHGTASASAQQRGDGVGASAEKLLQRVTVLRPANWAQYCACLREQLEEELLTPPHVALVVVEHVNRLFCVLPTVRG